MPLSTFRAELLWTINLLELMKSEIERKWNCLSCMVSGCTTANRMAEIEIRSEIQCRYVSYNSNNDLLDFFTDSRFCFYITMLVFQTLLNEEDQKQCRPK